MSEQQPDRHADDAVHALLKEAKALAAKDPAAALARLERQPCPGHGLYHHARGALCLRVGRLDDGVAALEEAVRLLPEVADVRANLGAALLARARPKTPGGALGRDDDAVAAADANLARFPDDVATQFNKASALKAGGRVDDARAVLRSLVERHPQHPAARAASDALTRLG
jgi:predicted Zn-dependent protease